MKLILLNILLLSLSSFAQETKDYFEIEHTDYFKLTSYNTINKMYFYKNNFSLLRYKFNAKKKNDFYLIEQGNQSNENTFYYKSVFSTKDYFLNGEAQYSYTTIKNCQWNEISNYDIIYPYIIADTIGGDFNSQNYYLNGDFIKRFNNWHLGINANLHYGSDYRTRNPRPKNEFSKIKLNIGISYNHSKSITSIGLGYLNYKQNNQIKMFDSPTVLKYYFYKGLGEVYSYNLVKGITISELNNNYSFNSFSINLQNFTNQKKGFIYEINYQLSKLEQIPNFIGKNVLFDRLDNKLNLKFGYQSKNKTSELYFYSQNNLDLQKGNEFVYKKSSNGYSLHHQTTRYYSTNYNSELNILFKKLLNKNNFSLNFKIKYTHYNEKLKYNPEKKYTYQNLNLNLNPNITIKQNKGYSQINIGYQSKINISHSIKNLEIYKDNTNLSYFNKINYYNTNFNLYNLGYNYFHKLKKQSNYFFTKLKFEHMLPKNYKSNYFYSIAIGVII